MALLLNRVRSASFFMSTFFFIFAGISVVEGLRPSDHGLQYQSSSPPTESHSPPGEMMSFFGGSRSSSSSPPPSQLLPKATDTDGGDDDTWWRDGAASRRDQVIRHVFLAASIVCGVSGVALLVVFTLVYFFSHFSVGSWNSNYANRAVLHCSKFSKSFKTFDDDQKVAVSTEGGSEVIV